MDVGNFWGFQADEASLEKQRHLTAEINKRTLRPVAVSLYPNLLCLAPYSEIKEQSLYYRAKILHLRGNTVEVNMCLHTAVLWLRCGTPIQFSLNKSPSLLPDF